MSFAHHTDGELLTLYLDTRNEVLFEELFQRHAATVLKICQRASGRGDDAEDIVQGVFVTLLEKAHRLSSHPSLAAWLYRVAWHMGLRNRRTVVARRRNEQRAGLDVAHQAALDGQPDLLSGYAREQLRVALFRAIHDLPEIYREPIILHDLQGLTVEESARQLNCKVGTVASRLSRGRDLLRDRMGFLGYSISAITLAALMNAESSAMPVPTYTSATAAIAEAESCASAAGAGATAAEAATIASGVACGSASAGLLGVGRFLRLALPALAVCGTVTTAAAGGRIWDAVAAAVRDVADSDTSSSASWPSGPGSITVGSSGSGVPEPSSLAIFAVSAAGLLHRRRGNRTA
jgi:RNA polymerase sigma factor (sigma-70 family)